MSRIIETASNIVFGSGNTVGKALAKKKQQHPQYDYLWRVELPSLADNAGIPIEGGFMNEISTSFMDAIGSGMMSGAPTPDDINHRITSFDSPFFQLDTKKVTNKNSFWYTASNNDIGSISFNIHEMEDGKTLQYLTGWQDLIINSDGSYNPPIYYKRPVRFYRLSAANLDLHEYVYEGFFINEIATMNNSYDGNGLVSYSVTLTGDTIAYNFMEGAEVRSRVMAKELEIIGKSWVDNKVRLAGNGVAGALQKAGGLANIIT